MQHVCCEDTKAGCVTKGLVVSLEWPAKESQITWVGDSYQGI